MAEKKELSPCNDKLQMRALNISLDIVDGDQVILYMEICMHTVSLCYLMLLEIKNLTIHEYLYKVKYNN